MAIHLAYPAIQRSRRSSRVPARVPSNVAEYVGAHIGNTPLIRLKVPGAKLGDRVALYVKAEFMNPGGSVKDRPALFMIRRALAAGAFDNGRRLLDATSGNTGIAYAMIGASLDIPVTLAMPENASTERKLLLRAYGAELMLTDRLEGTDGAQRVARELARDQPGRYHHVDQYNNPANWQAHFETTGPEILEQTGGLLTHFVAALGTTGTFTGVGRRLRAVGSGVRLVAVQPDSPLHGIEGMKHLETAIVPGIFEPGLVDETVRVGTEEARAWTRRLAREEGLLVGVSSGANVAAAVRVAQSIEEGVVVTVLCDSGSRYLSDSIWSEAE